MNDNACPGYDGQEADLKFCDDLVSAIETAEAAFRRCDRPAGVAALVEADRLLSPAVSQVRNV